MCGIVGYVGSESAAPVLFEGLKKLEYRGYDSAGIAVFDGGKLQIIRREGRVAELESACALEGTVGIGHTRWATHGAPSERNAHPHSYKKFTLVHNGIIENQFALKEECLARGEQFASETDTEVIAHLIENSYRGDFLGAVSAATARLTGSYAIAVLCSDFPDTVVCARMHSPLVVGKGKSGLFVASDLPAIAGEGVAAYSLEDGEFAVLRGGEITFYNARLEEISKKELEYDCDEVVPDTKGYRHFMRKEMAEIPAVLAACRENFATELKNEPFYKVLCETQNIHIIACGTAYHAGLCAKHAFETLCRVPVEVCVASEYRYKDPIVPNGTLCIAVSQSGETADTLAAALVAKEKGAYLAAVTNVAYSSLTKIADCVLMTKAGREVAVAATKSFNAQLMQLFGLAALRAEEEGRAAPSLDAFPRLAEEALKKAEAVRSWTPHFLAAKSVFFLGRGADYCTALEGSLKLKEISYLPSEGYAAGELKHGTLALIEDNTPVVAILTQKSLAEKTMNAVHEVYARGAKVFLITTLPEYCGRKETTASVLLPDCPEPFSPVLSSIPLQALAYYVSLARGNNPDKPRNLAKSVTVE